MKRIVAEAHASGDDAIDDLEVLGEREIDLILRVIEVIVIRSIEEAIVFFGMDVSLIGGAAGNVAGAGCRAVFVVVGWVQILFRRAQEVE